MNKRTIESELINILDNPDHTEFLPGIKHVRSYSELGLLTKDKGLVLTFESGEQFQLTIKRAK